MPTTNDDIIFSETQRFKQWWIWLVLAPINALFLFGVYKQVIGGQQFGNKPMSNTGLLITTGFVLLLTASFFIIRLDTKIKKDGIYVRFFPFHLSYRAFNREKISQSFIRVYNPLKEHGGWGIRSGSTGKALTISGDKGIQLYLSNGSKLLIGTQKPDEVTQALQKTGLIRESPVA